MKNPKLLQMVAITALLAAPFFDARAEVGDESAIKITVDWRQTIGTSKTTASVAMVAYPLMRQGSPIAAAAWNSLEELNAKYVRYVTWFPYPRLAVAELEAPTAEKTSWDFSLIDPEMIKFLETTRGREPIVNFSVIPAWMLKTEKPAAYPDNPDQASWDNNPYMTSDLVDRSGKQLSDYYARIVSWYTQGGFTDENGKYHRSGYHYEIPWWGVLNEVQAEYQTTPQEYVKRYDTIVAAIRKVSPKTKFVGLALAPMGRLSGSLKPTPEPEFFQYFLDPKNHQPGISLDMMSYHFYATPSASQTLDSWQYSFFDQADGFLANVALVESIRKRLAPSTRVNLDELGILLADDWRSAKYERDIIPEPYWNLYGAFYAYLYLELAKIGIDVATLSEFLNYPGNQRSCSLLNWKTGKPLASLRILKLIRDNFGPGDKLAATSYTDLPVPEVEAQAFATAKGRKLLVINKRMVAERIDVTAVGHIATIDVVDVGSGDGPPRRENPNGPVVHLEPFAVAVLSLN